MDDTLKRIQYFSELFEGIKSKNKTKRKEVEKRLLEIVNNLSSEKIDVLSNYYEKAYKKFIQGTLKTEDKGSVKVLRYILLQLLRNQKLTSEIIDAEKKKIQKIMHKDVFHSWKNDRILYRLCYYNDNEKIEKYLDELAIKLRKNLKIFEKTKQRVVEFNGSQNQGYDHAGLQFMIKSFHLKKKPYNCMLAFGKIKLHLMFMNIKITYLEII